MAVPAKPGVHRALQALALGVPPAGLHAVVTAGPLAGIELELNPIATLRDVVEHVREHPVDAVIVGSDAPGDGPDTVRSLRLKLPHAAVVCMGGLSMGDGVDAAVGSTPTLEMLAHALRTAAAVAAAGQRLASWALRDPLTEVFNRRGLAMALDREGGRDERGQGPISALLVDCDDFKSVNDRFGLATGDLALKAIADALIESVRAVDTVARIGGDEFLVLLPQARTWEAVEIAERVRTNVRTNVQLPDGSQLSVSIGVRRLPPGVRTLGEVLAAAQTGLTVSKAAGKDSVHIAEQDPTLDEPSSPPTPLHPKVYSVQAGWHISSGAPLFHAARLPSGDAPAMALALQRAAQASWDLAWFQLGLAVVMEHDGPLQSRLYPATFLHASPERILSHLPGDVRPDQVVVSIDEQYLSGDPGALVEALDALRTVGFRVCVEISDFGRSSLEGLIVLRPEVVRLSEQLVRGVATLRRRRGTLRRLLGVCRALGGEPWAAGVNAWPDRDWLECAGVMFASGTARPTRTTD